MLQTLRNRLIFSHILPMLVAIPIMGLVLVYVLESRFVIPQMANNLLSDAHLLSEISRSEYEIWGNPVLFERLLNRVQLDPNLQVMFLNPDGFLLYSSDSADRPLLGQPAAITGLNLAQSGQEVVLTNYTGLRLHNVLIDVLEPVVGDNQLVIGIIRVTYRVSSGYELLTQMRFLVVGVLIVGLLLGAILGLVLAVSINRPVQQVTSAIYDLARGERQEPLKEQGPLEMREQARAVNFLVERLHSLEQSRRQLLANLVHELGRPLGAMRSAIHALATGANREPHLAQELIEGMDEEAIRLQHILDDLAHMHDQLLGTFELNLQPVGLSEWLPRMLHPWQEAAEEKNLHWETSIPPHLPVVQADTVRLAQVIGNLLSNAIKYTPTGRNVSVSAGNDDQHLWVCVADNGPGIPKEEQEKIFTPFYRGEQGRRIKQGMGLGLSIARELAQAHAGEILVESTPGLGSSFTLKIPILLQRG